MATIVVLILILLFSLLLLLHGVIIIYSLLFQYYLRERERERESTITMILHTDVYSAKASTPINNHAFIYENKKKRNFFSSILSDKEHSAINEKEREREREKVSEFYTIPVYAESYFYI